MGCESLSLWTSRTVSDLICRFRWVYCQIVYLRLCLPGRILHALDELPGTLDETYERALRNINKANWEIAYRLLQCVAVALRPLRVAELAEILSFDFETGPVPKFHEDWRLGDSIEAILSTTSGLLAKVDVKDSSVIQFSHFSVKEYLTSSRLAETNDIISGRYHISMTSAHTLAAQACLGILLHLDKNVVNKDGLKKYPLAAYAARYWVDHARFDSVSGNIEDGMKRLFDPSKEHLAIWVGIFDPMLSPWLQTWRELNVLDPEQSTTFPWSLTSSLTETPLSPTEQVEAAELIQMRRLNGSPLHYAAHCGLHVIVKSLIIQHSQDVHSRRFDGKFAPLHLASQQGHADVVRLLLEHGADLTAPCGDGSAQLHEASREGREDVTHLLLEDGADVAAQNDYGFTPLHVASSGEVARLLLAHGADVTTRDKYGFTPLHRSMNVEFTRSLLEHGADTTARTYYGLTPLHHVFFVDIARLLLEHGADLTARTFNGSTPLHHALDHSHVDVTRLLLEYGADPAARTNNGSTPLHQARNVELARLLLEHGADPAAQTNYGLTPLHMASRLGCEDVALLLLDHGADMTAQTKNGSTPIHLAVRFGCTNVLHSFLDCGGDVTVQRKDGSTLLHLASRWGHVEVVRFFLEHGMDVTAANEHGWSALHLASHWGHVEVARFLLDHGANVAGENNYGSTPLRLALRAGHVEVACLLAERGADATSMDEQVATPLEVVLHQEDLELVRVPERESMRQPGSIREPRTGTVVFVALVVAWGMWSFSRHSRVCVQISVPRRTGNLTRS